MPTDIQKALLKAAESAKLAAERDSAHKEPGGDEEEPPGTDPKLEKRLGRAKELSRRFRVRYRLPQRS